VLLEYAYSDDDYAFLMQHDDNAFSRWAAAQALASNNIISMVEKTEPCLTTICQAFKTLLADKNIEPALKAEILMLPALSDIQETWLAKHHTIHPQALFNAKKDLQFNIAQALQADLLETYQNMCHNHGLSDAAMQQRKLQGVCLSYLVTLGSDMLELAYQQFSQAKNMTEQYTALALLADYACPQRSQALAAFEKQWGNQPNVMDKWFAVQASSSLPHALEHVKTLMQHPQFSIQNPNKVRAVVGSFAMRNPMNFHAENGSGYQFIADCVLELDQLNPQIAARMVRALMNWKQLASTPQVLMQQELQRIANTPHLSGDVFEIVSKSLQTA